MLKWFKDVFLLLSVCVKVRCGDFFFIIFFFPPVILLYTMDVLFLLSSRLRGFFVAPQTNNYTFWIQADGQASLYLSLSQDPKEKVLFLEEKNEMKWKTRLKRVLIKVITSRNFPSVDWFIVSYESIAESNLCDYFWCFTSALSII